VTWKGPVLVTGAAGFVGIRLAQAFRAEGARVHAIVRPQGSRWRLAALARDAEVHEVDLRDRQAAQEIVARLRPAVLVHAAVRHAYLPRDVSEAVAASSHATAHFLAALGDQPAARFLFAGSALVYGDAGGDNDARRESDPMRPTTLRGAVKAGAALLVAEAARQDAVDAAELRLFAVYGPWEEPRRLIPAAIRAGLERRSLPLTAPGIARDYVHVDDVAEAFLRAARLNAPVGGKVWNIGSGQATTNEEVVSEVERALGVAIEQRVGDHAGSENDVGLRADPTLAREELGWQSTTSFADGIARTAAWWREHGFVDTDR
jgi:nucleoside-diphosphate-sugar epimerase